MNNFGWRPGAPDLRDFPLDRYARPFGFFQRVKSKVWECHTVLDQGQTGHCVGFANAGFGNCEPLDSNLTNQDGHDIYYLAKTYDNDTDLEGGTSLRSGAKAMKRMGRIPAYAFAYNVDEIAGWVLAKGSIVMGTYWFEGMSEPDANGFVRVTGSPTGGHAWLILGYKGGLCNSYFECLNSWGEQWGSEGRFKIYKSDLDKLLKRQGEAVTAVESKV